MHGGRRRAGCGDRRAAVREDEVERAKENLKGRIMLSMESTSNRMSRLGKAVVTDSELLSLDRILAEIEAVGPRVGRALPACCSRPTGSRSPRSGRARTRFLAAVEQIAPAPGARPGGLTAPAPRPCRRRVTILRPVPAPTWNERWGADLRRTRRRVADRNPATSGATRRSRGLRA